MRHVATIMITGLGIGAAVVAYARPGEQPKALGLSATATSQESDSITRFVQGFYDWYTTVAHNARQGSAVKTVLQRRGSMLSPELARMLRIDVEAQERATGEIVGLDFDPFLNTQDPCQRYVVDGVTRNARGFSASVFAVCSGRRSQSPEVVVELDRNDRMWVFTNFRYPELQTDLMTVLRENTRDRERRPQ